MRQLSARIERHATAQPFVIARGTKHHVDVVVAEISDGALTGRGEGTPIYYRGDSAEQALAQVRAMADAVAEGLDRTALLAMMPPSAARNALDAALWDWQAKSAGRRVWDLIGMPAPRPLETAVTVSLGTPAAMAQAARTLAHRTLLKLKLGGAEDGERVAAVRRAAPAARLIADVNEGWAGLDVERLCHDLHALGVELIEQPLPAGADADLAHVRSPVPLCADESLQSRAELETVAGRYRFINVKLDKCGGLTEALALGQQAERMGLGQLTGCMLSTSLGCAPAFVAAQQGAFADLDGPLLLAQDRPHGLRFQGSEVLPPKVELWG